MLETDEFVSGNSEGFVMDSDTITKAYLKMKNLCINLSNEIQTDIKIHNQHIFPRYLKPACFLEQFKTAYLTSCEYLVYRSCFVGSTKLQQHPVFFTKSSFLNSILWSI